MNNIVDRSRLMKGQESIPVSAGAPSKVKPPHVKSRTRIEIG